MLQDWYGIRQSLARACGSTNAEVVRLAHPSSQTLPGCCLHREEFLVATWISSGISNILCAKCSILERILAGAPGTMSFVCFLHLTIRDNMRRTSYNCCKLAMLSMKAVTRHVSRHALWRMGSRSESVTHHCTADRHTLGEGCVQG